ncbi:MAG: mycothione reductase [Acidimicrobiia bacterium]
MKNYDLVIVGAGSGNMLPSIETEGWRIAIVESDRFGGTCLNRGCIPSKIFVYTADIAESIGHAARFGITAGVSAVDWPAIRDRVFARIDPIHQQGVDHRRRTGVDVYLGSAHFVDRKIIDVDGEVITGERIVVAAGSRPFVPDIPGLDTVPHHTSDTIMRIDALPSSMLAVGGGFISAEMSHIFGSLGTRITIAHRGKNLLSVNDEDISRRFTDVYAKRFDVRLGTIVESVRPNGNGLIARLRSADGQVTELAVDTMLLAAGRIPNTDILDATRGGLDLDEHGHIATDDTYLTSVPGVWALGDVTNHFQLKHMANAETRVIRRNLLAPESPQKAACPLVPAAVFADPQVASVGMTEAQARATGKPYLSAVRDYSTTAYGWALEDTTSFAKVIADPETRLLLGAHIMGPQAATLIQPLIQAMTFGNTIDQLAHDVLYIHPALTEVIENVLLDLR